MKKLYNILENLLNEKRDYKTLNYVENKLKFLTTIERKKFEADNFELISAIRFKQQHLLQENIK